MDRSLNTKLDVRFKYVHAPVDIILPFYAQYQLLGECLRSLITTTLGQAYSITVVDDASPNRKFLERLEKERLKNIPVQYLRLEQRSGFGAALHRGFISTHNPWVCFLHADCRIEQTDWLLHMLNAIQRLKGNNVKLISAKVNDGGTGFFDEAVLGDKTPTKDVITENSLPLICALVHRDLFKHIGGFVKPYPYFSYEDEELFWRMKLYGYRQAVCGKAFIHHEGGATAKQLLKDPTVRKVVEANKDNFIRDIRELNAKKNKVKSQ